MSFDIPIGENPDDFFEKAKRAYVEKIEELKRKLGGGNNGGVETVSFWNHKKITGGFLRTRVAHV